MTRFPELNERLLFRVEAAFSPASCEALIAELDQSEELRRVRAKRAGGLERMNDRAVRTDPALAAAIFDRLGTVVPTRLAGMDLLGANECIRFYRYQPGDYFLAHRDTHFQRSPRERSLLSVMLYLNQGYQGGELDFPEHDERIRPTTGLLVAFGHRMLHASNKLVAGTKYALRTDLMYRMHAAISD